MTAAEKLLNHKQVGHAVHRGQSTGNPCIREGAERAGLSNDYLAAPHYWLKWNRTTKQKPGPAVISTSFLHLLQQEAEASKWHPTISLIQCLGSTGTLGCAGGTQLPTNRILQLESWSGITGTRTPVFIPVAVLPMCSTQTKANPSEKRLVKEEDKSSSFCCWKFEQDSRTWSYPAVEMHWLAKASACTQQCSLTGRACLSNSFFKTKPLTSQREITVLAQMQSLTTCFISHW